MLNHPQSRPSGPHRPDPARILVLPGLVVLAVGGLIDVAYHLGLADVWPPLATLAGEEGLSAHLAVMAGMALVALGLIAFGVRATLASRFEHAHRQTTQPTMSSVPVAVTTRRNIDAVR